MDACRRCVSAALSPCAVRRPHRPGCACAPASKQTPESNMHATRAFCTHTHSWRTRRRRCPTQHRHRRVRALRSVRQTSSCVTHARAPPPSSHTAACKSSSSRYPGAYTFTSTSLTAHTMHARRCVRETQAHTRRGVVRAFDENGKRTEDVQAFARGDAQAHAQRQLRLRLRPLVRERQRHAPLRQPHKGSLGGGGRGACAARRIVPFQALTRDAHRARLPPSSAAPQMRHGGRRGAPAGAGRVAGV